jgi:hypothetical protein
MGLVVKDSNWRIPDELWKRGLLKYDKLKGTDGLWLAMDLANVVKNKSSEKFKQHKLML